MDRLTAAELIRLDYRDRTQLEIVHTVKAGGIDAVAIDCDAGLGWICQGSRGWIDWLRNFWYWPSKDRGVSGLEWHGGMLQEARCIWYELGERRGLQPIWIAGHSRGAGVAQPLAVSCDRARGSRFERAYLFSSPKPLAQREMPAAFADLAARIDIFNLSLDPVPLLPFDTKRHKWSFFGVETVAPVKRVQHGIEACITALEGNE